MLEMIPTSIAPMTRRARQLLNISELQKPKKTLLVERAKHMSLDVQSGSDHAHHGNRNSIHDSQEL